MNIEKLREDVNSLLAEPDIQLCDWEIGKSILLGWKAGLTNRILTILLDQTRDDCVGEWHPERLVVLDKDQSLPVLKGEYHPLALTPTEAYAKGFTEGEYQRAQGMLDAGWRRIVQVVSGD